MRGQDSASKAIGRDATIEPFPSGRIDSEDYVYTINAHKFRRVLPVWASFLHDRRDHTEVKSAHDEHKQNGHASDQTADGEKSFLAGCH
jgi:hypothetical protein